MRDKLYWTVAALLAGTLLFLGRGFLQGRLLLTWTLVFAGTTAGGVLLVSLYRVRMELRESRHELTRKEAELSFAYEVQRALFPQRLPVGRGLEFAAAYVPARGIGGDYYDVLELPGGRLGFAVADISGKGISAAILMANLQALLRTLASSSASLDELGARMNRHVHDVTAGSKFATLFYAEWDVAERQLRYVNAGHNPPFLLGPHRCLRLDEAGVPLGLFPEAEIPVAEVSLEPGDLLVLYSDGITERGAHYGEEFGEQRLEELLSAHRSEPLERIQSRVLAAVDDWCGREAEDDMTLVLVRTTGKPGEVV